MALSLLGRKVGMTRVFNDAGVNVPVTVLQLGPCVVTQVRTKEKDGYTAVQIGFEEVKARRSTIPVRIPARSIASASRRISPAGPSS